MPYLTPDTLGTNRAFQVTIPDQLLPIIRGAIADLVDDWQWEAFGAVTVEDAVTASNAVLDSLIEVSVAELSPKQFSVDPLFPYASGGVNIYLGNGAMWTYSYIATENVLGAYLEYCVYLSPGYWELHILGPKNTNLGRGAVSVDGVYKDTVDWYATGLQWNVWLPSVLFQVTEAKNYLVRITNSSKQGTGYSLPVEALYFRRVET